MEDQIINYIIHRKAKSLFFLNKIGYFYIKNTNSITQNNYKLSELTIKFIFIYLKFIFDFSKNNKYEKDMFNILLTFLYKNFKIIRNLSDFYFLKDFKFYYNMINLFLQNKYISEENKNLLQYFQNEIYKKVNK